ncbi:hypothetical protein F6Y03_30200 [Bacillus megaterium]|nr:hypothetical protein [Priestia megaterium]
MKQAAADLAALLDALRIEKQRARLFDGRAACFKLCYMASAPLRRLVLGKQLARVEDGSGAARGKKPMRRSRNMIERNGVRAFVDYWEQLRCLRPKSSGRAGCHSS